MPTPSLGDFPAWCRANLKFDPTLKRYRSNYETNAASTLQKARGHAFFAAVEAKLAELQQERPAVLMSSSIDLITKPFESIVEKAYRVNIVYNRRFPAAPNEGWVTPDNWVARFNDVVRGMLVCKYLDGPARVAAELERIATQAGLVSKIDTRANDSGYYAYHFYIKLPVELVDLNWEIVQSEISVEIQITTQLQEVMRDLTHKFYEDLRIQQNPDRHEWKWQFGSPRFRASYLGHTLHLLEGIIVQLKDEMMRENGNAAAQEGAEQEVGVDESGAGEAR